MDAYLSGASAPLPDREADQTRRHGVGAAWLVACIAHDTFLEGDVEWLMEIAARRCGDLPADAD